jgi:hypothetical protein
MKNIFLIGLMVHGPILAYAQQTAKELVAASITFHDPENNWQGTKSTFHFSDTRPGKDARTAVLYLNNAEGALCIMREDDNNEVTRHIAKDKCTYDIDGNTNPSASEIEKFKLSEDRSLMLRNYYLYLWGLPMKLTDPGTIIDPEIYKKEFNGRIRNVAKVTYDANVGSDTWYFYFNQETNEMIGYQFYHNEEKGDGEYIILSNIVEVNGMKIPKNRAWYTNPDSTLLGTDRLMSIAPLTHTH